MASLLALIEDFDAEIERFERDVERELADHPGYHAIQAIPGVGPVIAAIFVAEIGDVTRFNSPALLCSWAGLIPRHRESGTTLVGPDHQAGLSPRALGGGRGGERQAGGTKLRADFARITATHDDTQGARSRPGRPRPKDLHARLLRRETAPSARGPSRPRERVRTPPGAWPFVVMAPGSPAWPRP